MSKVTTKDGVEIFYKDWGKGQPIVFSHGWPLSADDWDAQMMFFLNRGFRVIAHDRRGHGRSTQTGDGHDMDHYADDLAAVTAHLDLKNVVHVGHSTGGVERGALRILLRGWETGPVLVHALHRREHRGSARVRAFVDHLRSAYELTIGPRQRASHALRNRQDQDVLLSK